MRHILSTGGDIVVDDTILLGYGSGGRLYHRLLDEIIVPAFKDPILTKLEDQANFSLPQGKVAFTTDSFVVTPIFFPGGDIGKLAVCGTVNDLAVGGARPLYLSSSFIIEEGFSLGMLQNIVFSMKDAADEAGIRIVTGDTKVVEKGKADGIFINTSGIGIVPDGINIDSTSAKPGDAVILSGYIGDHGIAVMSAREKLMLDSSIISDVAPLNGMIQELLEIVPEVRIMRDPTRGGVATTLNELAQASGVSIKICEEAVPVREEVAAACEIMGFDPLYVANEGKVIVIVPREQAKTALLRLRRHPHGYQAAIIGEVTAGNPGKVFMQTSVGGLRLIDMMTGAQLPRIC